MKNIVCIAFLFLAFSSNASRIHNFVSENDYNGLAKYLDKMGQSEKFRKVNKKNKEGQSPLHLAIYNGDKKMVELLLAHGADVTSDCNSVMPIQLASLCGFYDLVDTLFKAFAKIPKEPLQFDLEL